MNCTESEIVMNEYFDNVLHEKHSAELFFHFAECKSCQISFKQLLLLKQSLKSVPEFSTPLSLDGKIENLIRRQAAIKRQKQFLFTDFFKQKFTLPIPAFAAIFAIIIAATAFLTSKYFSPVQKSAAEYVYVMQLPEIEVKAKF